MPPTPFAAALDLLAPYLPDVLVGARERAQLHACLRWLPFDLAVYWGVECRLAAYAPQVDVQLCVAQGAPGHDWLASTTPEYGPGPVLLAHPAWQRLRHFAQLWAAGQLPPAPHLWLGFDLAPGVPMPLPLIHVRTDQLQIDAAPHVLAPLLAEQWTPGLAASLERALTAAPQMPVYMGCLLARQNPAVRVTQLIAIPDAVAYLRRIGWPGELARVRDLLDPVSMWTTHVGLSLNIGAEVQPYLGLEMLNWTLPPAPRASWRSCLNTLVARGLCTPAKQDALLAYPGLAPVPPPDGYGEEPAGNAVYTMARNLLHIKLALLADHEIEAKAYLDVHQGWLQLGPLHPARTAQISHSL
ncbi:MAG: hypothetical protein H3C34_20665 [Caldilineaceae bacterium]|nr:hypothetical protein [Caldilineaceae bacterium]